MAGKYAGFDRLSRNGAKTLPRTAAKRKGAGKLQEDDPGWLKAHGMTEKQARQNRLHRYGRSKPGPNGQYRPT